MTTGHWDPGYGDIVSKLRRAKSAIPANSSAGARRLQETNMDTGTLDEIKERAKDMWLQPDISETSYNDHFKERYLDINDITTTVRPASSQRRHKPHPSDVFLTTRLHTVPGYGRLNEIPGYHNPDTTIGKDAYRVDGSLRPFEQDHRAAMRAKFVGRPHTPAVRPYKTIPELDVITDPIERQSTEAFLKIATKQDQAKILQQLRDRKNQQYKYTSYDYDDICVPTGRPKTVPALNRYLKEAGAEEAQHLEFISDRANGLAPNSYRTNMATLKREDFEKMRNHKYVHPTKRGDFLIHPEWPPKFTHHRLNGLSSVDIPYYPGRR